MFQAFAREYPSKIWPYIVQYLHFRILEFPLIIAIHSPEMRLYRIFTLLHLLAFYWEMLLATGHRIKHLGIKKKHPMLWESIPYNNYHSREGEQEVIMIYPDEMG